MHEYGLCGGILEAVQRRARGRPVARVRVRIGTLHRVADAAFRQAFSHVAAGTEAEHAALELIVLPARAVCRACQAEVESNERIAVCPQCGGVGLDPAGGDELILESLEFAAPAAGTA